MVTNGKNMQHFAFIGYMAVKKTQPQYMSHVLYEWRHVNSFLSIGDAGWKL